MVVVVGGTGHSLAHSQTHTDTDRGYTPSCLPSRPSPPPAPPAAALLSQAVTVSQVQTVRQLVRPTRTFLCVKLSVTDYPNSLQN